MSDLVNDGVLDLFPDFLVGGADVFDGLLINDDDVRGEVPVKGAPVLKGNAVIETEDMASGGSADAAPGVRGGVILDDHGDVVDQLLEFGGKGLHRRFHQFLEGFPFHGPGYFSIPNRAATPFR
jgi:hypothetical protein